MSAADQSGCGLKSGLPSQCLTQLHIRAPLHISPCLAPKVAIPARPSKRCRPKRLRPQKLLTMHSAHQISTTDPMLKALHLQDGYTMKQELHRRTQHKSFAASTAAFPHNPITYPTTPRPRHLPGNRRMSVSLHLSSASPLALHDISLHLSSASPLERPPPYRAHLLPASLTNPLCTPAHANNPVLPRGPASPPRWLPPGWWPIGPEIPKMPLLVALTTPGLRQGTAHPLLITFLTKNDIDVEKPPKMSSK